MRPQQLQAVTTSQSATGADPPVPLSDIEKGTCDPDGYKTMSFEFK